MRPTQLFVAPHPRQQRADPYVAAAAVRGFPLSDMQLRAALRCRQPCTDLLVRLPVRHLILAAAVPHRPAPPTYTIADVVRTLGARIMSWCAWHRKPA